MYPEFPQVLARCYDWQFASPLPPEGMFPATMEEYFAWRSIDYVKFDENILPDDGESSFTRFLTQWKSKYCSDRSRYRPLTRELLQMTTALCPVSDCAYRGMSAVTDHLLRSGGAPLLYEAPDYTLGTDHLVDNARVTDAQREEAKKEATKHGKNTRKEHSPPPEEFDTVVSRLGRFQLQVLNTM